MHASQEVLYYIRETVLTKLDLFSTHFDFMDAGGLRFRRLGDGGSFEVVEKRVESRTRITIFDGTTLVSVIKKHSTERTVSTWTPTDTHLARIVQVEVYKRCGVEIKFEQVYAGSERGRRRDGFYADKFARLERLLLPDDPPAQHTSRQLCNLHVGSDQTLASVRVELEYEDGEPDMGELVQTIVDMERCLAREQIAPQIPFVETFANVYYRKFKGETLFGDITVPSQYIAWAIKLDGVRGKGLVMGRDIRILMDDMSMIGGHVHEPPFNTTSIVGVQVERLDEAVWITDILCTFRIEYDNQNQYTVDRTPYPALLCDAIACLKLLGERCKCINMSTDGGNLPIHFQRFTPGPPPASMGYSTIVNDGLVVVTEDYKLEKIKYFKTVEMIYSGDNIFTTLSKERVFIAGSDYISDMIYEVRLDGVPQVVRPRFDRLVPN